VLEVAVQAEHLRHARAGTEILGIADPVEQKGFVELLVGKAQARAGLAQAACRFNFLEQRSQVLRGRRQTALFSLLGEEQFINPAAHGRALGMFDDGVDPTSFFFRELAKIRIVLQL
jgi:hypothetical protein